MQLKLINCWNASSLVLLLAFVFLFGCTGQPSSQATVGTTPEVKSAQEQAGVTSLGAVEIRQYQGKDLSSVNDFRENSIKGPQQVNITNYKLEITGLVNSPRTYTYSQALAHKRYSKVVTLNCVEGWSATILWEGVLIKDLLDEAGIKPGANTVIFHSYDGYSTSISLEQVLNRNLFLAYAMNNVTLPPERGFPFQAVAEDKWGYKWAKWITGIELGSDPNYKGYWESRGYSTNGDLNSSMYGG